MYEKMNPIEKEPKMYFGVYSKENIVRLFFKRQKKPK